MPDYNILPPCGSVSFREAIEAGKGDVSLRARDILIIIWGLGAILPICGLSLWLIPVSFVTGIVASFIYTAWMTPKWRIWAYSGVDDIHQLQRYAELEHLLPPQSPFRNTGIMNRRQRLLLHMLRQRFEDDCPFIDDPDVPPSTTTKACRYIPYVGKQPLTMILSDEGIVCDRADIVPWPQIRDERVVTKNIYEPVFLDLIPGDTGPGSATTRELFFCFTMGIEDIQIPLSSLDLSAADMDRLFYIYRGRYSKKAGS